MLFDAIDGNMPVGFRAALHHRVAKIWVDTDDATIGKSRCQFINAPVEEFKIFVGVRAAIALGIPLPNCMKVVQRLWRTDYGLGRFLLSHSSLRLASSSLASSEV